MTIEADRIRRLAEDVLSVTVGLPLRASAGDAWKGKDTFLTGMVDITGNWSGVVAVHCTVEMARALVSCLCQIEVHAVTNDDIGDTLCELANILGGNVKALLPGPCSLSLPSTDLNGKIADEGPGTKVWLEYAGEPLLVNIVSNAEKASFREKGSVSS